MAEVGAVLVPQVWALAQQSLLVLSKELVMARLVYRDFEPLVAQYGQTVNTRKPAKLTAKAWVGHGNDANGLVSSEIEVQRPTATNLAVTLDKLYYTAFCEEDLPAATSIVDIRELWVRPAIVPLAEQVDDDLLTEFITGTDWNSASCTVVTLDGTTLAFEDIVHAMKTLNENECPLAGRRLVLGTDHHAEAMTEDLFVQAQQSGSTEALTNASLGRKFGFDCYMSQNVPVKDETVDKQQSIAFHQFAEALVVRPLKAPDSPGAVSAALNADGVSIRVTRGYDHRAKGTIISFDCLYGVQLLDAALGVVLRDKSA